MFLPDFPEKIAKELCKLSWKSQLKVRRILSVELCPISCLDKGQLLPVKNGFILRIRIDLEEDERLFTLGHELGHTYFYSYSSAGSPRLINMGHTSLEETWCDNFSKEWLKNLTSVDRDYLEWLLKYIEKMENKTAQF